MLCPLLYLRRGDKMFYKVIYNNRIIDALDKLIFLKYQDKYNRMIFCEERDAQAIMSSDGKHIWHTKTLYNIPVDGYDTVELIKIDKYEYEELKKTNAKTSEEIIDEYNLLLLELGVI